MIELNKFYETYRQPNEHNYHFIDMYEAFCDDQGLLKSEYSLDGVHLTTEGYGVWMNHIDSIVEIDWVFGN